MVFRISIKYNIEREEEVMGNGKGFFDALEKGIEAEKNGKVLSYAEAVKEVEKETPVVDVVKDFTKKEEGLTSADEVVNEYTEQDTNHKGTNSYKDDDNGFVFEEIDDDKDDFYDFSDEEIDYTSDEETEDTYSYKDDEEDDLSYEETEYTLADYIDTELSVKDFEDLSPENPFTDMVKVKGSEDTDDIEEDDSNWDFEPSNEDDDLLEDDVSHNEPKGLYDDSEMEDTDMGLINDVVEETKDDKYYEEEFTEDGDDCGTFDDDLSWDGTSRFDDLGEGSFDFDDKCIWCLDKDDLGWQHNFKGSDVQDLNKTLKECFAGLAIAGAILTLFVTIINIVLRKK